MLDCLFWVMTHKVVAMICISALYVALIVGSLSLFGADNIFIAVVSVAYFMIQGFIIVCADEVMSVDNVARYVYTGKITEAEAQKYLVKIKEYRNEPEKSLSEIKSELQAQYNKIKIDEK